MGLVRAGIELINVGDLEMAHCYIIGVWYAQMKLLAAMA